MYKIKGFLHIQYLLPDENPFDVYFPGFPIGKLLILPGQDPGLHWIFSPIYGKMSVIKEIGIQKEFYYGDQCNK